MKKTRSILCTSMLLMLCCALLLSSCGGGNSASSSPVEGSNAVSAASPSSPASESGGDLYSLPLVSDGSVTFTYSGLDNWYTPASYADNLPLWQEVEARTGVKIVFDVLPSSQYHTTMNTRMAAGQNLPDILMVPSGDVVRFGAAGMIIPLEDLFQQNAPNILKLIYEDQPVLGKLYTAPDGHIYHVAENFIGQNAVAPKSLIVRKDWLDKLGHSVPTTTDEWYTVLKDMKEKDPNGNGKADEIPFTSYNGLGEYGYMASGFGLPAPAPEYYAGDDNKVKYIYVQPEFKEFLTFLNKLYSEGLIDPQYASYDEAKTDAMVSKNIVGMSAHFATVDSRWNSLLIKEVPEVEYILVPPPVGPDGTITQFKRSPTGAKFAVSKDCKNPEIAVQWIDYIYGSDEGVDLLSFGVEGTTWEYDASGEKKLTDWALNNPDGLDIISALRSTGAFPALFTNRREDFYVQLLEETTVKAVATIMPNLVEPFPDALPLPEESERLSSLSAEIKTYTDEMVQKFIMGQISLDQFDAFVQQLEDMNLAEMIAIKQAQYDRYNAG